MLVEATSLLRDRGIDARVEIIGEGRERDTLSKMIQRLKLDGQVRLPGRMDHAAIRERYARGPIFVLPSIVLDTNNQDGVANALLEAMASGLAVVVSDIPALLEVVDDGRTGLAFPAGDPESLAECVERLITQPQLRAELGRAARQRVEPMSCSRAAEQLAGLFTDYAES